MKTPTDNPSQDKPGFTVWNMDDALAYEPDNLEVMKIHHDRIGLLIYPGGNEYSIELSRLNTPQRVLWWVHHLSHKNNVKKEHIRALVDFACVKMNISKTP